MSTPPSWLEEGTLLWRLEHSAAPPHLAGLLDEVTNTLRTIETEAATAEGALADTVLRLVREGVKE